MCDLTFQKMTIPAADLGRRNCLPDLNNNSYIHSTVNVSDNLSKEDRQFIGKGMISTLLPYQVQDGYNRKLEKTDFNCAVLENEYLKAVFVIDLGGRLWSLYDKKHKIDLLYKNDVFKPCNLALRNAWFSGGVEWNIGIKGHTPFTCSPLFAQKVYNSDNKPVLKMYEYERIRGVSYGIYATLDKDVLLVHPVIENTSDKEKYMYWWSNIAVEETENTRVIVPAKETFYSAYNDGSYVLDIKKIPYIDNIDVTYPTNFYRSRDLFFKIPDEEKKWIAAVNKDGEGLLQFSDGFLKGRKMFVWGQQKGGKHWNKWLSESGRPYIEIQAGILRTQLEHFIMDKNCTLSWTEGYTYVNGNSNILHGEDYPKAVEEISSRVNEKIGSAYKPMFDIVKEEPIKFYGSGWGALENKIRKIPVSEQFCFPENSMNSEQEEWLYLIKNNRMPVHKTNDIIESYVVGEFWLDKLKNSDTDDWYKNYHLGVLYYTEKEYKKSLELFNKSNEQQSNAWALRNMAQIEKNISGNTKKAALLMQKAVELKSDYIPLLTDCVSAFISAGMNSEWIKIYNSLDDNLKNNGRLKMMSALCYTRSGNLEEAKKIMNKSLVVPDLKEGEYSLSSIWCELYSKVIEKEENIKAETLTNEEILKKYPLPFELDFRMN